MSWWKKYAIDEPYPEPRIQGPNPYYASLLQDDYSGFVSEFTAIAQYLYHHSYFRLENEELGRMLEGISIIEMHHMELLAQMIIPLGGDPRYGGTRSTCLQYWSGVFPGYGCSLCERLRLDLQSELEAIRIYRCHLQLIRDPGIQAVLERIILDEEHHVRLFREQIEKLCR